MQKIAVKQRPVCRQSNVDYYVNESDSANEDSVLLGKKFLLNTQYSIQDTRHWGTQTIHGNVENNRGIKSSVKKPLRSMSINSLPDELLCHVLSLLPFGKTKLV